MKKCIRCLKTKDLTHFRVCSRNKDGRTAACSACKRAYDNADYKAHPNRRVSIRANSDERVRINKEWIYAYLLEHGCVDCPETDPVILEFDHQGDKVMEISRGIRTYNLKKIQAEVAKCEVRCANCHRRKTSIDFGWWRYGYASVV